MNLPNSWNVCPNCGTSTQSKVEPPSGFKAGDKETKNYKRMIDFLLLAGIGLYIVFKLLA